MDEQQNDERPEEAAPEAEGEEAQSEAQGEAQAEGQGEAESETHAGEAPGAPPPPPPPGAGGPGQPPKGEAAPPQYGQYLTAEAYRVKGEMAALYVSVALMLLVLVVVVGLSCGIVLILVGISVAVIMVRQGQLLGSCVRVSDQQLREVHEAALVAADRLSMVLPPVFVKQDPVINAFALGFLSKQSVVLHSATVESLNQEELVSVIGHEFSHIKCGHTTWLALTGEAVAVPVVSELVSLFFLRWMRKAEYTCDRGGVLASRDLKASVCALAKVAVGKQLFEKMDLNRLFAQRMEVEADWISRCSEVLSTHPYIVKRIHALRDFHESDEYRRMTGTS